MNMEIEGLPERGTQLTSLRDMLVSLQKQDPPIDVCFELLGSLTSLLSVCVCVSMCAHVTNVCVSPCLQNPPYVGQMGRTENREHPRACTPASEHQAGLAGCQQAGGPGLCIHS